MIELRTPAEIEAMRPVGRFVAETLATLRDETKVGTNLLAIDRRAHDLIKRAGAESCYIDYHPSFGASPFGKVICTSINDAVLHGLPHDYVLRDGDLVSLDFAVSVDGWVADSAVSFVVGTARDEDLRLIDTAERALDAAIATATVGHKIGDISAAIAAVAHGERYSINTDFGGHGVGRIMHGDPHIPNDGKAGRGYPLRAGLVVALEPWFLQTTDELITDPDGWTLRSADGSRGAHAEHTVAVTADGPIVLTDRSFLGVPGAQTGRGMVSAIHNLARALSLECTIKGIENDTQLLEVSLAGYRYAQGYLLARPMPLDAVLMTLVERETRLPDTGAPSVRPARRA